MTPFANYINKFHLCKLVLFFFFLPYSLVLSEASDCTCNSKLLHLNYCTSSTIQSEQGKSTRHWMWLDLMVFKSTSLCQSSLLCSTEPALVLPWSPSPIHPQQRPEPRTASAHGRCTKCLSQFNWGKGHYSILPHGAPDLYPKVKAKVWFFTGGGDFSLCYSLLIYHSSQRIKPG